MALLPLVNPRQEQRQTTISRLSPKSLCSSQPRTGVAVRGQQYACFVHNLMFQGYENITAFNIFNNELGYH